MLHTFRVQVGVFEGLRVQGCSGYGLGVLVLGVSCSGRVLCERTSSSRHYYTSPGSSNRQQQV